MPKPKLLWISDSPAIPFVGQSVVARECLSRLSDNYEIEALGFSHASLKPEESEKVDFNIIPCTRPDFHDPAKVVSLIQQSKPDIVCFSHDNWLFPTVGDVKKALPNIKFTTWTTIDGEPAYHGWYRQLKPYDWIYSPTQFGKDTILSRWLDLAVDVVPYGVNHQLFHPPAQGKAVLKQNITKAHHGQINLNNRFFCLFVGANQDRKNLAIMYEAWKQFEKGKEDKVLFLMVVHSASLTEQLGSFDLSVFIRDSKTLLLYNTPLPKETIGMFTAAADCLFHPCHGEGWGLCISDAMACGTVPIVHNYAGSTDFCKENSAYFIPNILYPGGFHVNRAISPYQDAVKILEQAYNNPEERAKKSACAIEAVKEYTWDRSATMLAEKFKQVLAMDTSHFYVTKII